MRRRVGSPLALLLRELRSSATPVCTHESNRATPLSPSRCNRPIFPLQNFVGHLPAAMFRLRLPFGDDLRCLVESQSPSFWQKNSSKLPSRTRQMLPQSRRMAPQPRRMLTQASRMLSQASRMPPHENWTVPQPLVTLQQPPGSESQWPGTHQQTPGTLTRWPGSHSQAPGRRKLSPGTQAYTPGKLRQSPGKQQQSPVGPNNSPGGLAGGFFAAWTGHCLAAWGQTVRRRVGSPLAMLLRGLRSSATPARTHESSRDTPPTMRVIHHQFFFAP